MPRKTCSYALIHLSIEQCVDLFLLSVDPLMVNKIFDESFTEPDLFHLRHGAIRSSLSCGFSQVDVLHLIYCFQPYRAILLSGICFDVLQCSGV